MAARSYTLKQYLHRLADSLPDTATIDEALYHLVLRREIEAGLADSDAGRATDLDAILERRGIQG
jgi:predicted transcriptional regulator